MFSSIQAQANHRIGIAQSMQRAIVSIENGGVGTDVSKGLKGLLFVHNYAIYEYVITGAVQGLIDGFNSKSIGYDKIRTQILCMALNPEFKSIIDSSSDKTWEKRITLTSKLASQSVASIPDGLFPKDGSFFRPSQLKLIWEIFGLPGEIVPENRLLGFIDDLIEKRNAIAHGQVSAEAVGARFTAGDIAEIIRNTEKICTHILSTFSSYNLSANAFFR